MVPRVPVEVRKSALLLLPEREAVGVPLPTLMTANRAEAVETPPRRKSWVVILSKIAPLFCSKGEPPLITLSVPAVILPLASV